MANIPIICKRCGAIAGFANKNDTRNDIATGRIKEAKLFGYKVSSRFQCQERGHTFAVYLTREQIRRKT
jgi:hypothetical protein